MQSEAHQRVFPATVLDKKAVPTRRKFVTVTASAAGLGLLPFGISRGEEHVPLIEWQGVSLGGVATIRLYHPNRAAGQRLLERVVGEARRLEAIFTLYEADSVLCDLNRRGVLVAPLPEQLKSQPHH
jgi:FAD:protein FMN transferase